jgi:hypothetical protein
VREDSGFGASPAFTRREGSASFARCHARTSSTESALSFTFASAVGST